MMMWSYIFGALAIVIMAASLRLIVSSSKTLDQRLWLIDQRRTVDNETWHKMAGEFDAVDYDAHMWMVYRFKDPMTLYGPITQAIIQSARTRGERK